MEKIINKKATRPKSAFTLIELIIIIFIVGAISSITISNYRNGEKSRRVAIATDTVINVARTSQNYTLTGRDTTNADSDCRSPKYYFMEFSYTSTDVSLYAHNNCGSDDLIQTISLPANTRIKANGLGVNTYTADTSLKVAFFPPFGKSEVWVNDNPTSTTFSSVRITLESTDGTYNNTVEINGISGRIGIYSPTPPPPFLPSPPVPPLPSPFPPIVITLPATDLSVPSVTLNATGNPNGYDAIGWFRYSTTDPGTCDDTFGPKASNMSFGANWQSYGSEGSGANQFTRPLGINVAHAYNKIYVADFDNNRIARFDSGGGGTTFGANFQSFGSAGSGVGRFDGPGQVAVDTVNHKVYVADTGNTRVARFDSGGGGTTLGATWQTNTGYGIPTAVTVDFVNNKIYVSDVSNNRVVRANSGAGGLAFGSGKQNFSASGSMSQPLGINAIASENKVYVADYDNSRILRFDSGSGGTTYGGNLQTFGSPGSDINQFSGTNGLTVDDIHNKIYISDDGNNRIVRFDTGGGGTTFGGSWENSASIYQFTSGNASDVGVDTVNNKLFVADTGSHRIAKFDSGSGAGSSDIDLGDGTDPVPYSVALGGLNSATTYYFCAIAENSYGKGYGDVLQFTTTN
jgi:DNA-binding beta-propeller fold protein YncE/Tfp pilus assembly protein PilE